jgi:PIN domain nuclease of toxin-antitoxin system
MRLLLDTVAFIWLTSEPQRIPKKVRKMIEDGESHVRELSAISLTEIAIKQAKSRLDMTEANVMEGIESLQARVLPYNSAHALMLFRMQFHHKDPFDRMLIAQALAEDIPVVTPDEAFRKYKGLKVIWG